MDQKEFMYITRNGDVTIVSKLTILSNSVAGKMPNSLQVEVIRFLNEAVVGQYYYFNSDTIVKIKNEFCYSN